MNIRREISSAVSRDESSGVAGPAYAAKFATVAIGAVVALAFRFGFGNYFALGPCSGVPILIAPVVAPAVDFSVVGLLLGTRQLAPAVRRSRRCATVRSASAHLRQSGHIDPQCRGIVDRRPVR